MSPTQQIRLFLQLFQQECLQPLPVAFSDQESPFQGGARVLGGGVEKFATRFSGPSFRPVSHHEKPGAL